MNRSKFLERLKRAGFGSLLILPLSTLAETDGMLSESLRQALEAQGWQAERAEDGSLIYRQPSTPTKQVQTRPSPQMLQREDLPGALQERGWRLHWSPDGNLILRPQSQAARKVETTTSVSAEKSLDELPDLPGFKYWQIEKATDGSWTFKPLPQTSTASAPPSGAITLGHCEGVSLEESAVSLPVDEWGEAKVLAQAWIRQANLQGLLVGRIRKVLGIYLISLVENSPPYYLRHQLAIRSADARVILLE